MCVFVSGRGEEVCLIKLFLVKKHRWKKAAIPCLLDDRRTWFYKNIIFLCTFLKTFHASDNELQVFCKTKI